jgi:Domain of unknown function (DUF4145)
MSELVADCPRCGAAKITFDLRASVVVGWQYQWQQWHEAFCVCRHCGKATIFVLSDQGIAERDAASKQGLPSVKGAVNDYVRVERYITARDRPTVQPPEHLPDDILAAFKEGATCIAADCCNAAGTMFRLCIDIATRKLLPEGEHPGLNARIRRDLGLRLPWLFDNNVLPAALRDLSHCIKEDGNDGAHAGNLTRVDAEDLLDFTSALLERLYTEPKKVQLANERRLARRAPAA